MLAGFHELHPNSTILYAAMLEQELGQKNLSVVFTIIVYLLVCLHVLLLSNTG